MELGVRGLVMFRGVLFVGGHGRRRYFGHPPAELQAFLVCMGKGSQQQRRPQRHQEQVSGIADLLAEARWRPGFEGYILGCW